MPSSFCGLITAALLAAHWGAIVFLERLNRRYAARRAGSVPEPLRPTIDPATYARAIHYTRARSLLVEMRAALETATSFLLLWSGILPWTFAQLPGAPAPGIAAGAFYLLMIAGVCFLIQMPLSYYSRFRVEEQFGFNTSTRTLWWRDQARTALLAVVLGYPLLLALLALATKAGSWWWLWAALTFFSFQLVMIVLAPIIIVPLFNKLSPLPAGPLRERLLQLGEKTGFRARQIQVMDGSKRSRHANAFFPGFGRFRRIVLFDTLLAQLTNAEVEAVLAHEIGHYKKGHIPKLMAWSFVSSMAFWFGLSRLAMADWFLEAFGFHAGALIPFFAVAGLLAGPVLFWLTPAGNWWSRRYEYQADAFAREVMGESDSMRGALRKLNVKNLSNMVPHPLYSTFYYSHPTLLERERALALPVQS